MEVNVIEDLGKWTAKEVWSFDRQSRAPFLSLPVWEVNSDWLVRGVQSHTLRMQGSSVSSVQWGGLRG